MMKQLTQFERTQVPQHDVAANVIMVGQASRVYDGLIAHGCPLDGHPNKTNHDDDVGAVVTPGSVHSSNF